MISFDKLLELERKYDQGTSLGVVFQYINASYTEKPV